MHRRQLPVGNTNSAGSQERCKGTTLTTSELIFTGNLLQIVFCRDIATNLEMQDKGRPNQTHDLWL